MKSKLNNLSKREREIMQILFQYSKATAREIQERLDDNITYSTVRTLIGILEKKGHVKHEKQGKVHIYSAMEDKSSAAKMNLNEILTTFYNNSVKSAVVGLLGSKSDDLSDDELTEIINVLEEHKRNLKNNADL